MDVVSDDEQAVEDPRINKDLSIDELCLRLKAGDPYARSTLELHVKRLYRDTGGLQCVTTSLLPIDLTKITDDELINVCDNMMSQKLRTKKADMCSRIISSTANIGRLIGAITGLSGLDRVVHRLDNDPILRSSLMELFIGKNVTPRPVVTLGLCVLDYSSDFLTALIKDGKYASDLRAAFTAARDEEKGYNTETSSDGEHKAPISNTSDG